MLEQRAAVMNLLSLFIDLLIMGNLSTKWYNLITLAIGIHCIYHYYTGTI